MTDTLRERIETLLGDFRYTSVRPDVGSRRMMPYHIEQLSAFLEERLPDLFEQEPEGWQVICLDPDGNDVWTSRFVERTKDQPEAPNYGNGFRLVPLYALLPKPFEQEPVGWRPIESAPKDGTPLLVWMPEPILGSRVHAATIRSSITVIAGRMSYDAPSQPTHWMPLPTKPTDE